MVMVDHMCVPSLISYTLLISTNRQNINYKFKMQRAVYKHVNVIFRCGVTVVVYAEYITKGTRNICL